MDDEQLPTQRPPSPPFHLSFKARGVRAHDFSQFRPRDIRLPVRNSVGASHVAWNCDGRRLALVGGDKVARVWQPDRSLDPRQAITYSHGHTEDIDHVSWNPTHPDLFCTVSGKDRRAVFWDARRDKHIQRLDLKRPPASTLYTPNGKSIIIFTVSQQMLSLHYGKSDDGKEEWTMPTIPTNPLQAYTALFNHTGDSLAAIYKSSVNLKILDYPSFQPCQKDVVSNIGGVDALALDPCGKYLITGGQDTVINVFDVKDWVRVKTITTCEHPITGLSVSHDGEYIAASTTGDYIDIFGTESGETLHRVKTTTPSPTVAWHPSKHVIAYCGRAGLREHGQSPHVVVSLFGPGVN